MEQAELAQCGILPSEKLRAALEAGDRSLALSVTGRLSGEFTEMHKGMRFLVEECMAYDEPLFREAQASLASRIQDAIKSQHDALALRLIDQKLEEYRPIHDAKVDCIASCFDWVIRNFGDRQLEDCLRHLAEGQRQGFERWQSKGTIADFVRAMNYSVGAHLGKTRITEDDEKFTMWLDPCGSGGQMVRQREVEPEGKHARVVDAQPMTFQIAGFPAYCCHCAVWHGLSAIEWFGQVMRVMEPARGPEEPCRCHIFKDANDIPAEYYELFGRQKPAQVPHRELGSLEPGELDDLPLTVSQRVQAALAGEDFDRALTLSADLAREYVTMFRGLNLLIRLLLEYCELLFQSHQDAMAEQITSAAVDGNATEAGRLIELKRQQHLGIHDTYVHYVAAVFTWIHRAFGDEALYQCHNHFAQRQKPFMEKIERAAIERRVRGFANTMAQHGGKVRVQEDAEKFSFFFDPCGSGGALWRDGHCDAATGRFSTVSEPQPMSFGVANYPSYCGHCAVWNSIAPIEWWGHPQTVYTPMRSANDACVAHIYKDPSAIPAEYYRILGKEKP